MKVFIIAAITVDGYIGRDAGHSADWTSPEDKKLFVSLTKDAGTIVMGSRTFATIGRALPGRRTIVYTSQPEKIVPNNIETTVQPPSVLVKRLRQEGVKGLAVCGGASIYELFMRAGVVDQLYITIEPKLFGRGVPLFGTELNVDLNLLDINKLNTSTVLLHYDVKNL